MKALLIFVIVLNMVSCTKESERLSYPIHYEYESATFSDHHAGVYDGSNLNQIPLPERYEILDSILRAETELDIQTGISMFSRFSLLS